MIGNGFGPGGRGRDDFVPCVICLISTTAATTAAADQMIVVVIALSHSWNRWEVMNMKLNGKRAVGKADTPAFHIFQGHRQHHYMT